MATCPHCRGSISGQSGTIARCPFCNGRVRFYRTSSIAKQSSIPPLNLRQPSIEYKPPEPRAATKPKPNVSRSHQQRQSFSEIYEDLKLIVFDSPFQEEEQILWEIKEGNLIVKSRRLDYFGYKEEVEIPTEWRAREPEVNFLNGILSFSWQKN